MSRKVAKRSEKGNSHPRLLISEPDESSSCQTKRLLLLSYLTRYFQTEFPKLNVTTRSDHGSCTPLDVVILISEIFVVQSWGTLLAMGEI